MNSIAVVLQYYGKLKPSFTLWYESARRNSNIDFFIFTDNDEPEDRADNVKWVSFTLSDFNRLAVSKLGVDFSITNPYKLCDFKSLYGAIFADYLAGYDYWAYGDLDVVYGRITDYLERIDYKKYYKINHAGHFCLMKNIDEVNNLFKADVAGTKHWKNILESGNCAFDEIDTNAKAKALGIPFYDGIFAADMMNEKGMQVVDKKIIEKAFHITNTISAPINYHYQIFISENGRIVRYYRKFFKVLKDEFAYIHYRLELPINLINIKTDTFIFSYYPMGFFDIDTRKLTNMLYFMKTVRNYNNRHPIIVEKFLAGINLIKRVIKRGSAQ
ncbi:MAG: hypothetical protein IKN39_03865 [Clostridia bacterium]|nr:hypothetical protein [Clostridia bacterium]